MDSDHMEWDHMDCDQMGCDHMDATPAAIDSGPILSNEVVPFVTDAKFAEEKGEVRRIDTNYRGGKECRRSEMPERCWNATRTFPNWVLGAFWPRKATNLIPAIRANMCVFSVRLNPIKGKKDDSFDEYEVSIELC